MEQIKIWQILNQDKCNKMGKSWATYDMNFDNILNAMRTLYIISSLEGWPDLMYLTIDSNTSDTECEIKHFLSYKLTILLQIDIFDSHHLTLNITILNNCLFLYNLIILFQTLKGPIKDNYFNISYFFIFFILVGSFFLVNLFVGVIFLNFNQAQKNENQSALFLTDEQKRWIEFQQMIIGVKAEFSQSVVPTKSFPRLMYRVVTSNKFEIFIMILIVFNIVTMGMVYEGSSEDYNSILENINLFFTICFMLELIMKVIAFKFAGFWANDWNKFDLFVVVSSVIDIILNQSGALSTSFLRIGPQLIRIIRVFRVSRLLKLVKSMKGLQKLIETLLFSLPSLINVGALLMLVFFIYAVLGVFLFKDIKQGVVIDRYNNFSNFGFAMLTLFRCSTGENWYQLMFDCGKTSDCTSGLDCGSRNQIFKLKYLNQQIHQHFFNFYYIILQIAFSTVYYVTFVLICSFIMLNLFILIIIQYFEDYHMKDDNPLQAFNDKLEIFRITWSKYTKKTLGEKINSKEIVDFLYDLPIPLGYYDPDPAAPTPHPTTKKEIAKQVMNWALSQQIGDDQEGYIFFNDLLFACMRKEYGSKLMKNAGPEIMKMLNKLEVETRLKIAEKKKKSVLKKNKKHHAQNKSSKKVNPMIAFMFLQMTFKAWNNYHETKLVDGKIQKDQINQDKSSSSTSSDSQQEDEDEDNDEQREDDEEEIPNQQKEQQSIKSNQIKQILQSRSMSIQSNKIKQTYNDLDDKEQQLIKEYLIRKDSQHSRFTQLSRFTQQRKKSQQQDQSRFGGSQKDKYSSSSSSGDSFSSSPSDSESEGSSSSSDEKEDIRLSISKKLEEQKSKKGQKSIYETISEKDDEEVSPTIPRQRINKLRRIGTLNMKKLDNEIEFGQTSKYHYIKKDYSQQNESFFPFRKSSAIGVEVSKNSIFYQNNKIQKQNSLKLPIQ